MKQRFNGMYFKQQGSGGALALIPAQHIGRDGHASASIQIVREEGALCAWLGGDQFRREGDVITIGESRFSPQGVHLEVTTSTVTAAGDLRFQGVTPPRSDVMGPLRFLPLLECRHSVYSLFHRVEGSLTVNGKTYLFDDGDGYIEGDSGRSFPKKYLWTQCAFGGNSLMLSVAEIPYCGLRFTGVLCLVLYKGREYRLATYSGAKLVRNKDGLVEIRQGNWRLRARLFSTGGLGLKAPVTGEMTRVIREQLSCRARYAFEIGGKTRFDFSSECASFEYEY